ncbi:MAG: hypothetical protein VB120_02060 [Lachnospiraceae bacterium]|nr:hypothetical protein [Lachnospiraceae bacterium]
MNVNGFVPYEMKTSIIKIMSYISKNPSGIIQNPYFNGDIHFGSLTELIMLMEDMLNDLNFPQESMGKRKFQNSGHRNEKAVIKDLPKEESLLATFKISVYFRQNASWQGNIVWLEKQEEAQFRSALEMIMLIDSVLSD